MPQSERPTRDAFNPVVFAGVDTVDATNVETEWLGHNLVIPSVLWDVFDLVKNAAPPQERFGLKRSKTPDGRDFWTFKLVHAVPTGAGA
ncbi:MAG: hypothetical protein AB7Q16_15395 [Vicinamibacterales bacterium]